MPWDLWKAYVGHMSNIYSPSANPRGLTKCLTRTTHFQCCEKKRFGYRESFSTGLRNKPMMEQLEEQCSVTCSLVCYYRSADEKEEPYKVIFRRPASQAKHARHTHTLDLLLERRIMTTALKEQLQREIHGGATAAEAARKIRATIAGPHAKRLKSSHARSAGKNVIARRGLKETLGEYANGAEQEETEAEEPSATARGEETPPSDPPEDTPKETPANVTTQTAEHLLPRPPEHTPTPVQAPIQAPPQPPMPLQTHGPPQHAVQTYAQFQHPARAQWHPYPQVYPNPPYHPSYHVPRRTNQPGLG